MVLALVLAVCLQLGGAPPGMLEDGRPDGSGLVTQVVPPATEQTPQSSPQTQPASPTKAPLPAHKKKHRTAAKPQHNVIVRNGSTSDPSTQFSTSLSPEEASREKQDTAGLLAKADANLQGLSGRQLNASQQDTSAQVRSYMQQAKAAEQSGDLQGAHSLAVKAVLLSNELVKK